MKTNETKRCHGMSIRIFPLNSNGVAPGTSGAMPHHLIQYVSHTSRLSFQLEALMRISRRARDSGKLLPLLPLLWDPRVEKLEGRVFAKQFLSCWAAYFVKLNFSSERQEENPSIVPAVVNAKNMSKMESITEFGA